MADWDGAGYERVSRLQRTMAERALAGLAVRGDEACLDVGCGDGYVTRRLAALVPRGSVLGVDPSPRMLDRAAAAPAGPGAPVTYRLQDVRDLDDVRRYDLVVSFNALHWVPEQREALRRLAAAVRNDGRLVLQQVCAGPRPSLESVAVEVCRSPRWAAAFAGWTPPFVHVDPAGYPDLARSAGLTVTRLEVRDESWDWDTRRGFADWCAVGFGDWTRRLDATDATSWVDDVVAAYEPVAGAPGRFRFLQLRAELVPTSSV
ncbi:class I SAM-dependent methyltransferase [Nakamurella endophytica]|uniref:SAM-dependent methyltransferase n=1 Tax=Nakamurella endophytica TaxID=1748367 RepID=A0A917SVN0_9ACTN|nr:class I SAM-dependent methyltransferase [Nakamurella endophytica]GGM00061.1 SAM-dependent methyltransferase [Nakamurella endophytica]